MNQHQIPAGEGAYRCDIPVHRFIELISGTPADNNSPLEVAARTVELIEAMHASAANDGTAVRINRSPDHSAPSRRPA